MRYYPIYYMAVTMIVKLSLNKYQDYSRMSFFLFFFLYFFFFRKSLG